MWRQAREVLAGALGDFRRSWTSLIATDIAYKAFGFAVLAPAITLLLRGSLSRAQTRAVADADIVRFFVTTRGGAVALLLGCTIVLAILAIEVASLMSIGVAAADGFRVGTKAAVAFAVARAPSIFLVSASIVIRIVAGLVPFVLAVGLGYLLLLRRHDINYYLAERPPALWVAAGLVAVLASALAAWLLRVITRWALALPLLVFEKANPRGALRASADRCAGSRPVVALVVAVWAVAAVALTGSTTAILSAIGRLVAPHLAGSLTLLLSLVAGLAALWAMLALALGAVNTSLFALIIGRLYMHVGEPHRVLAPRTMDSPAGRASSRMSRVAVAVFVAVGLLAAAGFTLLALLVTRSERPVLVIAHRGSAPAPENTLAAFRLAIRERADFVELDVQESLDGQVVVVHDSDLMKAGGSPMKIWESTAEQLRAIDIGSRVGPQFAGERVPTLAEVLAACKGRVRSLIELKSYGHDQRLEERVAEVVEAAGMENDCMYMSLDHEMVERMKRLRPGWRVGLLATKTLGDPGKLDADFLAIQARSARVRAIRQAHRAGDVYVWTVDDPASMLAAMGKGADGLITDRPALAREVVEHRAEMSDAERVLVALLLRMGERSESLEAEGALRP